MKKSLAIFLLTICGAAVGASLIMICMLLGMVSYAYCWLVCPIAVTLAATFGIDRLRILYKRKYDLKASLFYLCVYASEAVWAVGSLATTVSRLNSDYYDRIFIFAGMDIWYDKFFVPAETAALLAGALLWLAVSAFMKRAKTKSDSQSG